MTLEDRISERLLRWEEAWEHGQDIPPSELCAGTPELEPELRRRIAALKATDWLKMPPTDEGDELDDFLAESLFPRILGDRYRVEGLIAEGGQGQVYRAFDPELQRAVAIKVPRPGRVSCQPDALLEEARRAASLRHPGIVTVHDVGRWDGTCFLVADLIEGESLGDRIARCRPSCREAVELITEVAEALHFAHEQGFVHRDIKPANILIDRQGRPHITDFGIAARMDDLLRSRTATSGTLPYMAPEQVAGEVQLIDPRTDLYALGVVLYELLSGRLPYQARTPTALREQILFRPPVPFRSEEGVGTELERVVQRSLAKHPADRYVSARELADDLRAALAQPEAKPLSRRWPILLGAGVLGIGLILGLMHQSGLPPSGEASSRPGSLLSQDGVLVFDGQTRIVTPLERFAPVTLEAWVRPERYQDHGNQFLIGSDIPTRYGLGLSISGAILSAESIPGMLFSDQAVPLGSWSHLAVVFGPDESRLYLNGRRVHVGPATEISGGAPFVVGCAGRDNPIDRFQGQIRSVRISKGERYDGDFRPTKTFPPDDLETVLLYDGSHVEGGQVMDLSGTGHHGQVERVSVSVSTADREPEP